MTSPSSPRSSPRGGGLLLIVPTLLALFGVVAALQVSGSGSEGALGRPAPALPTEVIKAPRVSVADLHGEPAAINFWASWCAPCRSEAPEIERLHRLRGVRGRVVGVNWNDGLRAARSFVRDHRLTFPNLRDGDGAVGRDYGIVGLPTTVILDSRGRIAALLPGPQTVDSIRDAFESTR